MFKLLLGFGLIGAAWWLYKRESGAAPVLLVDLLKGSGQQDESEKSEETVKAAKKWQPPASASPYIEAIRAAELKYNLPENLLARQLYQESAFRADVVQGIKKSPVGAIGIAQFMPATARDFGIDPTNPMQSIDAAGRYMRQLYDRFGAWDKALAAYNWGMGNVSKKGLEKAPRETRNYFSAILNDLGF